MGATTPVVRSKNASRQNIRSQDVTSWWEAQNQGSSGNPATIAGGGAAAVANDGVNNLSFTIADGDSAQTNFQVVASGVESSGRDQNSAQIDMLWSPDDIDAGATITAQLYASVARAGGAGFPAPAAFVPIGTPQVIPDGDPQEGTIVAISGVFRPATPLRDGDVILYGLRVSAAGGVADSTILIGSSTVGPGPITDPAPAF